MAKLTKEPDSPPTEQVPEIPAGLSGEEQRAVEALRRDAVIRQRHEAADREQKAAVSSLNYYKSKAKP